MAMREYRIQLKDAHTGETIITAGGVVHVSQDGLPDKQTLFDKTGAALTNPITPTNGFINFFVADTTTQVDLYGFAPGGQWIERLSVKPGGPNEINVDTRQKRFRAKLPFSIVDCTAATEKDTGIDIPANSSFLDRLHGCGLLVTVLEASKTVSVGLLSSQSGGTATGLINASSTTNAGQVIGTNGSLFSTNAPALSDAQTAKRLSYTISTGAIAAKGFAILPYQLNG